MAIEAKRSVVNTGLVGVDGQALTAVDRQEGQSLEGRSILVIGGTGGAGLEFSIDATRLGASVYLGTRDASLGTFARAMARFEGKGVDASRVSPFVADIKNPDQVAESARVLRDKGLPLTDVQDFAAEGIGFGVPFAGWLERMNEIRESGDPDSDERLGEEIAGLNEQLDIWLPQYLPDAIAANFEGPVAAIDVLGEFFPDGFSFAFMNSTFGHTGEGPHFYQNVLTKQLMSKWLQKNAPALSKRGIATAEIVAPVIANTDVGILIIEDILPFWPDDIQAAVYDSKVSKADVVVAANQFLAVPRNELLQRGELYTSYVMRSGGTPRKYGDTLTITHEMPDGLRIDPSRFPF